VSDLTDVVIDADESLSRYYLVVDNLTHKRRLTSVTSVWNNINHQTSDTSMTPSAWHGVD